MGYYDILNNITVNISNFHCGQWKANSLLTACTCILAPYPSHSIHGPRNQCCGKTPSRFSAPAVPAHPGHSFDFWTRGKDGS